VWDEDDLAGDAARFGVAQGGGSLREWEAAAIWALMAPVARRVEHAAEVVAQLVAEALGPLAAAQVDLDVRQNRHQPISELASMSAAVLAAVTSWLLREGRLLDGGGEPLLERPPLAQLRGSGCGVY
jgi:hypothetical protein